MDNFDAKRSGSNVLDYLAGWLRIIQEQKLLEVEDVSFRSPLCLPAFSPLFTHIKNILHKKVWGFGVSGRPRNWILED